MSEYQTRERQPQQPSAPRDPIAGVPGARPSDTPQANPLVRQAIVLLLLVGLLWAGFNLLGRSGVIPANATALETTSLPGSRLVMDIESADVRVETWDGDEIRVTPLYRGGSADDYRVQIEPDGDAVRVSNDIQVCPFFCQRSLTYEVQVPGGLPLEIETSSGNIAVSGAGASTLRSNSGNIDASDLPDGLDAATASGNITLNEVAGALKLESNSGNVRLADGDASAAEVRTGSGNIVLEGVGGALQLNTNSGNLTVEDGRNAQLDLASGSGNVRYTGSLSDSGEHQVTSNSGNVTLQLPADSSFVLEATTNSGDVDTDFDLEDSDRSDQELRGRAGAGGAELRVEAGSGNISIQQR